MLVNYRIINKINTIKACLLKTVYNFYKSKNNNGFTIVELIVSISIIAVLTVMAISNFRGSNQKVILDNEAERIASVVRQMHIDSLIGQTVGEVRPRSFGFNMQTCVDSDFCEYTSFADTSAAADYKLDSGDDILQTIRTFEKNVEFSNIATASESNISEINIAFIPPRGSIQFFIDNNSTASTDESVEITLNYSDTSYSKKIIINRISGQIEIE